MDPPGVDLGWCRGELVGVASREMFNDAEGETLGPAVGGGGNIPPKPPPDFALGFDDPSLPSFFWKYKILQSNIYER